MNKAFYITGIVCSLVFFVVTAYYVNAVENARWAIYGLYSSRNLFYYISLELTKEAAMTCIPFFLLFITINILGLVKIKTTTVRVLSIIGLSVSGILLLLDLFVIEESGKASFDEVGSVFALYALMVLAFSIVGLVQSVRFQRKKGQVGITSNDLLDS
jgi:hypothetical protein